MTDLGKYMVATQTIRAGDGRKTSVWEISSNSNGAVLGYVKWYGAWRQYCFFPEPECIFNTGCLAEITTFMTSATTEHRQKAAAS